MCQLIVLTNYQKNNGNHNTDMLNKDETSVMVFPAEEQQKLKKVFKNKDGPKFQMSCMTLTLQSS